MRSTLKIFGASPILDDDAAMAPNPEARLRVALTAVAGRMVKDYPGLMAAFRQVRFVTLDGADDAWTGFDGLVTAVDAHDRPAVSRLTEQLRRSGRADRVLVLLQNADVDTTRLLLREGAADVVPEPVTEPALAGGLDRLLINVERAEAAPGQRGDVVCFLKAGGGVGATSLGTQLAGVLTEKGKKVCYVDLDIQFGSAGIYLDVAQGITMTEVLQAGADFSEMPFSTVLPTHASGVRVLVAPRELTPLEAMTTQNIEALLTALRKDFDVVLVDLPASWTQWTNRALRLADHIVLVSMLSVPHAHLIRRQLQTILTQRLDDVPMSLVCNRAGGDAAAGVSLKAVEKSVARTFDVVVPEDDKLMREAINQGVSIRSIKRGSKVEKALEELAGRVVPGLATAPARKGLWG